MIENSIILNANKSLRYTFLIIGVFVLALGAIYLVYNGKSTEIEKEKLEFINKVENGSKLGWEQYKIYPSITIAQAIVESDWGESKLAKEANNLFRLKVDKDWNGDYLEINKEKFKKYNNISDSIIDQAKLISESIGSDEIKKSINYKGQLIKLQVTGYIADSDYSTKIINIIETLNLQSYDKNLGE